MDTPSTSGLGGTWGCVTPSRQEGSGSELSDWKVTLPSIPPLFIINIVLGPIGTGVVAAGVVAESYLEISLINRIIYSG